MYVKIGSYRFPRGEVAITISRESLPTDAGTPWARRERWDFQGMIINQSGSTTDMAASIAALEAAFVDNVDIALLLPDGSTSSSHRIVSANTLDGVRVIQPPSFPDGTGSEYITHRSWTAAIEAIIPLSVVETALLSFVETVQFSGGGPRDGYLEPLVGRPIRQRLKQNTVYRATQQGQAVGLEAYPLIPQPIWPLAQIKAREYAADSPRRYGNDFREYPISWLYEFESAYPLLGRPHLWVQ
jgi:hypothetical protein